MQKQKKVILISIIIPVIIILIGIIITFLIFRKFELESLIINIEYVNKENNCLVKGNVCSSDDIADGISLIVNLDGKNTKEFYVLSNTENEMTLISKDNVIDSSVWYFYNFNFAGPTMIFNNLNYYTKTWTNIKPIKEFYYQDSGYKYYRKRCITGRDPEYECNKISLGAGHEYLNIIDGNLKIKGGNELYFNTQDGLINARTVTKEEIETLMNSTSKKIVWLENTKPFWTLTSATEKVNGYDKRAYAVIKSDKHHSGIVLFPYNANEKNEVGIRAVITINKESSYE